MTLTDLAERTRHAIYTCLAECGVLSERKSFALQPGITPEVHDGTLAEPARSRYIVLKEGEVEMPHQFATRSFGFR